MLGGHGSRRVPRPIAPALAAVLRSSADEIAKRWLVELVERTPLAATSGSQIEEISRRGGALVASLADALADDGALPRLEVGFAGLGGGSAELGAEGLAGGPAGLRGSRDLASILRSLDALQAAVWAAALEQLGAAHPRDVAELAERLALAMEVLRRGELAATPPPVHPPPGVEPPTPPVTPPRAADEHVMLAARLRRAAENAAPPPASPPAEGSPGPGAVPPPPADGPPGSVTSTPPPAEGSPGPDASTLPPAGPPPEQPRVNLRAVSEAGAGDGAAASATVFAGGQWVRTLEDEIRRARGSAGALALILIELEEIERLQASSSPGELEALLDQFLDTFRPLLRREDVLRLESWGKAWIISPGTGRFTARLIAGGVADELARSELWRGAPLRASAGIAILDEDGADPAALIDAAEQERFAASARGVALVEPGPL